MWVYLSNPRQAIIEDALGQVTIGANDYTLAVANLTVAEDAGTVTIPVTLSPALGWDLEVHYQTSAHTSGYDAILNATSGRDFVSRINRGLRPLLRGRE